MQFDKIGDWSSGVVRSEGHGTSDLGAVCLERNCEPSYKGFNRTTERIVDYQPADHQFTYKIVAGLPGMVQNATNTWTHVEIGGQYPPDNGCAYATQRFYGLADENTDEETDGKNP